MTTRIQMNVPGLMIVPPFQPRRVFGDAVLTRFTLA
jgi:hypothetical protein